MTPASTAAHLRSTIADTMGSPPRPFNRVYVLASSEWSERFANGGIGTYSSALLEHRNDDIRIAVCVADDQPIGTARDVRYADLIVDSTLVVDDGHVAGEQGEDNPLFLALQMIVEIATAHGKEVIIELADSCPGGFETISAVATGALGAGIVSIVGLHGPTEWSYRLNGIADSTKPSALRQNECERLSVELADVAFSPSEYLADRVAGFGWDNSEIHVLHNPVPRIPPLTAEDAPAPVGGASPIVFFGRLEERKGLVTFVRAVRSLIDSGDWTPSSVILMGKGSWLPSVNMNARRFIEDQLGGRCEYEFLSDLDREAALGLLQVLDDPIVFLGSPEDNFPNTALEVAQIGCRIVAAHGTGLEEALDYCGAFDPLLSFRPRDTAAAATALRHAQHLDTRRQAISPERITELNNQTLARRDNLINDAFAKKASLDHTCNIAVCVELTESAATLVRCLETIHAQTHPAIEVAVLDPHSDTSDHRQAILDICGRRYPNTTFIHDPHALSIGERRAALEQQTTADYIIHLTSEDMLLPDGLEALARAITHSSSKAATATQCTYGPGDAQPDISTSTTTPSTPGFIGINLRHNTMAAAVNLLHRSLTQELPWPNEIDCTRATHNWILHNRLQLTGQTAVATPNIAALVPQPAKENPSNASYLHRHYTTQTLPPNQQRSHWLLNTPNKKPSQKNQAEGKKPNGDGQANKKQ